MSVREIAEASGLSVASVSRALRGDRKMGESTRKRVLDAARKLGYSYNPYVGQMMSSLRRRSGKTFRGNIALIWKTHTDLAADVRLQPTISGVRSRAEALGYRLDEFHLVDNKPESLRRILDSRGIRGVLFNMPATAGVKVRVRMKLDHLACVSLGWGLWHPQLDTVRVDYYQMIRLALHHARHRFQGKIAVIWDTNVDSTTHNAGRASFIIHHPAGPAVANELFLPWQELSESSLAKVIKKFGVQCLLLGSGVRPPDWLANHVPAKNWVWFRDPDGCPHFGRIDPQNHLLGEWGVNLLASKIQLNDFGVPQHCQNILVPPCWIPGG